MAKEDQEKNLFRLLCVWNRDGTSVWKEAQKYFKSLCQFSVFNGESNWGGDINNLEAFIYLDDIIIFGRILEKPEQRLLKLGRAWLLIFPDKY